VPIIRGDTSRGAHVRALAECLTALIDFLPDVPSEQRVRLRNHLAALRRAYVAEFPTETDLAQALSEADEDGLS